MLGSRSSGNRRLGLSFVGALVVAAALFSLVGAPAQAARQITPPPNYFCGNYFDRTISIIPPRIWSSYNRPEQVAWISRIERWSSARKEWYLYSEPFVTWSSFSWYGQSLTSWSGRRFVNSKLNLPPVSHPGYYRVGSAIQGNQGGVKWGGYIGGEDAHCYMR